MVCGLSHKGDRFRYGHPLSGAVSEGHRALHSCATGRHFEGDRVTVSENGGRSPWVEGDRTAVLTQSVNDNPGEGDWGDRSVLRSPGHPEFHPLIAQLCGSDQRPLGQGGRRGDRICGHRTAGLLVTARAAALAILSSREEAS